MSTQLKRFLSLVLAFAMVLSYVPVNAFATEEPIAEEEIITEDPIVDEEPIVDDSQEEPMGEIEEGSEEEPIEEPVEESTGEPGEQPSEQITVTETIDLSDAELEDNDVLELGYLQKQLYGDTMSAYGFAAGSRLTGASAGLYEFLKDKVTAVAAGASSTVFTANAATMAEWGAQTEYDVAVGNAESEQAAEDAFWAQLSTDAVLDALMQDCPYELYWFDKTTATQMGCAITVTGENGKDGTCSFDNLTFIMPVAGNWQPTGYDAEAPTANTANAANVTAAVAKAAQIVSDNAGKSDYEKLVAYRDAILALVTYDTNAADNTEYSENNAAWQLINVFDGDNSTNVVCEGYSKAF